MVIVEVAAAELWADEDGSLSIGEIVLHRRCLRLNVEDGRALDLRVLSIEPLAEALSLQPGEGVEALLSRLSRRHRYPDALLLLRNPEQALGEEHMAHAQGVGLLAIDSPQRELCWDAALAKGLPIFGVCGQVRLSLRRPSAAAVLSALAFGVFTCHQGLGDVTVNDERQRVSWSAARPLSARVLIREGFEVAQISDSQGEWVDRGSEGVVRVVFARDGEGRAYSQPRFIMPQPGGAR